MSFSIPKITLRGGQYLGPGGVADGPVTFNQTFLPGSTGDRELDVHGCLVLPGIVDPHGDGFERHLAPRRGAATDLGAGLLAVEQELAAKGITTAVLAQFWSWEGGMRGPEFAERFASALGDYASVLDLQLQLRFEFPMVEDFDAVLAFVERHHVRYVVFNDHLPHTALSRAKRVPRLEGQAIKAGRSPEDHQALLERLHAQMDTAWFKLPGLAAAFRSRDVRLGSHDDVDGETRARWRAIGVPISEFPTSEDAALAAKEFGEPIILGAPNVVRGRSHKRGGLSARRLVEIGACDALASDYHYPSPLAAVRALTDTGTPIEDAWMLVSKGPADVLGLNDRGQIRDGLRADLIVADSRLTRVLATFSGGRPVYIGPELATRWIGT